MGVSFFVKGIDFFDKNGYNYNTKIMWLEIK